MNIFTANVEPTGRVCHCGGVVAAISRVDCDFLACERCGTTSRLGGRVPKVLRRKKTNGMVMPASHVYLLQHGHLYAHEADAMGDPNGKCLLCDGPTDLIWLHPPIPDPTRFKGTLPGTVWGKDVAVLCRCCSTAECPHCLWHGELVIGHRANAHGFCQRCGKRLQGPARGVTR